MERSALELMEVESSRLLLFVREQGKDDQQFSQIVRTLASLASPMSPAIKDAVLEFVRLAKQSSFSRDGCAYSLVSITHEKVMNECRKARLERGEQLVASKPEEHKVTSWAGVHEGKKSNVPATWDDMQKQGVLYGDGHHSLPVVVTETTVSPRSAKLASVIKTSKASGAAGHQSAVVPLSPAKEKALNEIEAMFGEDVKFDDMIKKNPRGQAQEIETRNRAQMEQKLQQKKTRQHLGPPVATAAGPPPEVIPSRQINHVLPTTVGGLRVVK